MLLLADVAGMGGGRSAVLGDLAGNGGQLFGLAADDGHGGSQACKLVRGAAPDTAATAGDDHHLAGKQPRSEYRLITLRPHRWLNHAASPRAAPDTTHRFHGIFARKRTAANSAEEHTLLSLPQL